MESSHLKSNERLFHGSIVFPKLTKFSEFAMDIRNLIGSVGHFSLGELYASPLLVKLQH